MERQNYILWMEMGREKYILWMEMGRQNYVLWMEMEREKWIKGEFSKREDNIQLWFKVLILVIRFMKVYCTNKNDKNCTINWPQWVTSQRLLICLEREWTRRGADLFDRVKLRRRLICQTCLRIPFWDQTKPNHRGLPCYITFTILLELLFFGRLRRAVFKWPYTTSSVFETHCLREAHKV